MNNCEQVKEWLPYYIDRQMSPELTETVRRHIQTCPDCASWYAEAEEMSALWRGMEENPELAAAGDIPDLTDAVMKGIEALEQSRPLRPAQPRRRQKPGISFMHYGVAACLTFLLFQFGIFEHLGYGMTEVSGHMSSTVTALFGR